MTFVFLQRFPKKSCGNPFSDSHKVHRKIKMSFQCTVYDLGVLLGHWNHHLPVVKVNSPWARSGGLPLGPQQSTSLSCACNVMNGVCLKRQSSALQQGRKRSVRAFSLKHCCCPWHQGSWKQQGGMKNMVTPFIRLEYQMRACVQNHFLWFEWYLKLAHQKKTQ